MSLIIPYYSEGFDLDWTRTIPINNDDVAMYIHPRVAITFEKIWSPEKETQFSVGHFIESCEDLDCPDFLERVNEFKPYKSARVRRVFAGKRKSIFFDEDECAILSKMFSSNKFTAIINFYIDGVITDVKDMGKEIYNIVKPFLEYYKIISPMSADDYRKYKNTKVVRILKDKGRSITMKKAILKLVGGVVTGGVSLAGLFVTVKLMDEGFDGIIGNIQDAILADEDGEETE